MFYYVNILIIIVIMNITIYYRENNLRYLNPNISHMSEPKEELEDWAACLVYQRFFPYFCTLSGILL